MMANVAVRNWRFLYKMGISGCQWFEGLGNYMQVRKLAICGADAPTIGPDSPVVLSIKVLYTYPGQSTEQQGHMGRAELISTPFRDYERQIRQQFTDMFARSGFDAAARHRRNHPQPLGTRLFEPGSRILFRQGWQSRARRRAAGGALRQNRLREHRPFRRGRSSLIDYRGGSRGGTVAGSGPGS